MNRSVITIEGLEEMGNWTDYKKLLWNMVLFNVVSVLLG